MKKTSEKPDGSPGHGRSHGFTLVELLVALVIGLIAIGAVYSVYNVQQAQYRHQQLRVSLQQNLRGALIILEQEIRMAGFDPEDSGRFGITDVRRYDLVENHPDPNGQAALFYTVDVDENGALDDRNHFRNRELPRIMMYFDRTIGRRCLGMDSGGGRQPLAENLEFMGLAYAIDADGDGRLDTWQGGPNLIWAVDADNDNLLDTHLDSNDDAVIDERDDTDQDLRITSADGCRINPPIPLDRIRSVRVWLLASSAGRVKGHVDSRTFVVGDRIIAPSGDGLVRRIMETIIECRNL